MKIIIAGAGEVGLHLSKLLSFESHDITLIDNNDISLKDGENYLDINVVNGDSSSISVLDQANVNDCDLVIGVTASEAINFLTCILSKQLGAKRAIARKTGARGLRSILEDILMDVMFELPNENLEKVIIDENSADSGSEPIKVFKSSKKKSSAS